MNIDQQKFTTNDVLDVLTALELDVPGVNKAKLAQERQRTHSRLRAWHQRGILAGRGHCDGPGSERDYSFDDVLFLAAMIYTSRRVADLRNAEQIARHLHTFLKERRGVCWRLFDYHGGGLGPVAANHPDDDGKQHWAFLRRTYTNGTLAGAALRQYLRGNRGRTGEAMNELPLLSERYAVRGQEGTLLPFTANREQARCGIAGGIVEPIGRTCVKYLRMRDAAFWRSMLPEHVTPAAVSMRPQNGPRWLAQLSRARLRGSGAVQTIHFRT